MSRFLFLICLCGIARANAQVSIYDCSLYSDLTQGMIDSAGAEFYRPCIEMDSNFNFTGSSNKTIISGSPMHLRAGFHAGGFDSTGMLHLMVKPKADFDVAVMNYSGLGSVLRYEKLELGVQLPPDVLEQVNYFVHEEGPNPNGLNPFVEWEMKVYAVFSKQNSDVEQTVDGFYYRQMERDYDSNTWVDAGTDYPFRIRFAPPLNGTWTCKVYINLMDSATIYESEPFPFKVVESGNPGFAKVHANKKNFERGGEMFYPVGTNLPFDGGPGGEIMHWTHDPNHVEVYPMNYWERYVHLIDSYGTEGGRYIRIMNDAAHSEVEFEKLGNYYNRLKFANEMDKLLEVCHNNGTMIDFCLMYHLPLNKTGDWGKYPWDYTDYWPYGDTAPTPAYCYATEFNSTEPMDMIYNEEAFKYVKQRYRYYISRYGYSTNIYIFDLINEPWHLGQVSEPPAYEPYKTDATPYGDSIRAAVTKMQTELSDYIKNHLGHKQHMLGAIGYLSNSFPNVDETDVHGGIKTVNDLSWEAENIDVVCITPYSSRPDKLIIKKRNVSGNDNNGFYSDESGEEESYAYTFHQLFELYDKPIFLCEVGQAPADGCSQYEPTYIDVMRLGFTGLAGFNTWNGWRYGGGGEFDERVLWAGTIRAQQHMDGYDVLNTISEGNGQWLQGREVGSKLGSDELFEHQYYLSHNQELAVGFIYNRSFNAFTLGCPYEYEDLDVQFRNFQNPGYSNDLLYVQGLKDNTDYRIFWYSYKEGIYASSECLNTTSHGEYELRHPELSPWKPSEHPLMAADPPVDIPDQNPIMWYVIQQIDCGGNLGTAQGDLDDGNIRENLTPDVDSDSSSLETIERGQFSIAPNPFSAEIKVEASDMIGIIIIRDVQGKIVKREEISTNLASINTTTLGQGVYFLYSEKWNLTFKIIKL